MKIEAFTGTAVARILCVAGELFSLSKNDCVIFAYLCKGTFLGFVNIEEREINPKSSDIFDALKSDKKKRLPRRGACRGVFTCVRVAPDCRSVFFCQFQSSKKRRPVAYPHATGHFCFLLYLFTPSPVGENVISLSCPLSSKKNGVCQAIFLKKIKKIKSTLLYNGKVRVIK